MSTSGHAHRAVARRDAAAKRNEAHRRRADEVRHEQRGGAVVDVLRRTQLLDHAAVHQRDRIGHGHRLELVVRDVHGGRLEAVVQRAQLAAHHLAELRVQCAERLVEQERQGLADDRAAQRDALAVAARESRHRAVQEIGDPQNPCRLLDALPYLVAPHALTSQRIGDVRAHVHVRVEREELEHERDVALRRPLEGHVLAAQHNAPGRRQLEPRDHPERRRLAAARGPEQAEEIAVAHGEGRVAHRGEPGEGLVQMLDTNFGHRATPGTSKRP